MVRLGPEQRGALAHVRQHSVGAALDRSLRITLNFHPDRLCDGVPVLAALARDGRYRSQFETGTSNGGLTARPGGDRWRWESRMFAGAYDTAPAEARPVYGALDLRARFGGAAARFGSAYFRLTEDCLDRTTFCYPDSVHEDVTSGVADRMSLVALALADRADPLDDYVEAQVHGPVLLHRDVTELVLDPCFRGTEVEVLARQLPCPVRWHQGYRLGLDRLRAHPDYRGARVVALGERLAVGGVLDAAALGAAVRSGVDAQQVKRLWHCVARFGGEHR